MIVEKELIKKQFRIFLEGKSPPLPPEVRKQIIVGMTGGAFDVLHLGHVFTLEKAKEYCDFLVVVVSTDDFVMKTKGKLLHPQEYRKKMVESIKYVDFAIAGVEDRLSTLNFVSPDVIIFGYDQEPFVPPKRDYRIIKIKEHMDESLYKSSRIISDLGY
ncbi:MAG: adenylyltransferase/cytidyltransferase family protein [Candidatus Anstonellales archaeon]